MSNKKDIASKDKEVKYPKSVFFIVSTEFCERFSYYGLRTILSLYLSAKLGYSETNATIIFHIFSSMAYFFPLVGAVLADSCMGRFNTITALAIVYAIASFVITAGSIEPLNLPANAMTMFGLLLAALGSGGIKPCVSAFGGDQFKLPKQAKQLASFFSVFYFSINAGSLISTFISPILREDVKCFGEKSCFPLAFGVPAVLMFLAIILFVFGRPFYTIVKPQGNMLVSVSKCIWNAISKKFNQKGIKSTKRLLDYSIPKYGEQLVNDIRVLGQIVILYLPLPFFWALFDQQASRWTFQATRMDGDIAGYQLKPDQMQVINPLMILLFIPLFEYFLYPALTKVGINTPLKKLTCGGLLAGLAFLMSGLLELKLQGNIPGELADNEASVYIFNGMPCSYTIESSLNDLNNKTVSPYGMLDIKEIELASPFETFTYKMMPDHKSNNCAPNNGKLEVTAKETIAFVVERLHGEVHVTRSFLEIGKQDGNKMPFKLLPNRERKPIKFNGKQEDYKIEHLNKAHIKLPNDNYKIMLDNREIGSVVVELGGVYVGLLVNDSNSMVVYTMQPPNPVCLLWQIPQYVTMTAGEVMFSVTGLSFSYDQAPSSMKSVIQAFWLLTVAIGNLIVVGIAEIQIFESQANEFFLFSALMVADMLIFILLAIRYKYKSAD